jgi:pimeloyl-ACP methyl ester carboxylesterase
MSLWIDMLGTEIRFVQTKSFGRIRIAEAGDKSAPAIIFQHGINGHLEAYAKNLIPLSSEFRVIAFDYVGHGLSDKPVLEYSPHLLVEQLAELMDALDLQRAHLSGESLGGWVSGLFAAKYPHRVDKLMLNTAAGLPVVSEKGKADLQNLMALNARNVNNVPTPESVRLDLRLGIYLRPDTRVVAPIINAIISRHDDYLIPLDKIACPTLFLWTLDNPIHDLETARASQARIPGSELYVMEGDSAHWPQYEAPDEFNEVAARFFRAV